MNIRHSLALLLVSASVAEARILVVPTQHPTIQGAINASANGDTVLVERGTYLENINFRGKRIMLTSRFLTTGDPADVVATVIDGSAPSNPDTASCVIIANGEDSTTVLQGFTLTRGTGTKWLDEHGAGTYVEGGGVLTQYSSPVIRHNRIIGNSAARRPAGATSAGGGGIRVGDGVPRILNNVIMWNGGMYGGGVVLNYTGAVLRNNIIAKNSVYQAVVGAPTFGGGGVWASSGFSGGGKLLENNTIVLNSVAGSGGQYGGRGGGILVGATTVALRNNIVWGNTQTTGTQVGVILGGSVDATYNDVEGGIAGTGNIDLAPVYADTAFHLTPSSPGVDAGDPAALFNDPPDPGNPGFTLFPSRGTVRNDMGAYGGPARTELIRVVTAVGEGPDGLPPAKPGLQQNYPNPFNPVTTIRFTLAARERARLSVANLLGQEVAVLVDGESAAGSHSLRWDASGLPTGVYFAILRTSSFTQTRKIVYLR